MAALLRTRNILRVFNGIKHTIGQRTPHYELFRTSEKCVVQLQPAITRSFAVQQNLQTENVSSQVLDQSLLRIDTDLRKTGRIPFREVKNIFAELTRITSVSTTQSLLMIRCCGNLVPDVLQEDRTKLVDELWATLQQLEVPFDISHYNALLRVYLENDHKFSPIEFLAKLEQQGIEPNRVTYQRLIERYCQDGDIEGASKILEFMKEQQQVISENIFNSLIMGHSRANDMESASGILDIMSGAGLEPSSNTYTALLVGYAEHGDVSSIRTTIKTCDDMGQGLYDRDLMEVCAAAASKGRMTEFNEVLNMMRHGAGYNQEARNLILRLVNMGCDDAACEVLNTMTPLLREEGELAPSGIFMLQQLIIAKRPVVKILEICHKLKTSGQNIYSFETTLQAALEHQEFDTALALMRVMRDEGKPIRNHYFWPLFAHYGNTGQKDKIYQILDEMRKLELNANLETMRNYVLPSLIKTEVDEDTIIGNMKEWGMSVNYVLNGLMANHLGERNLTAALALLEKYPYRITPALRQDLAEACTATKDVSSAALILGQMTIFNTKTEELAETESNEEVSSPSREVDVAGEFLIHVTLINRNLLVPMGNAMLERQISIGDNIPQRMTRILKDGITEEQTSLLNQLSSLTESQLTFKRTGKEYRHMELSELESIYQVNKNRGIKNEFLLKSLMLEYARDNQIEKAEGVKQELDSGDTTYRVGHLITFLDMYLEAGNLEEAKKAYQDFKTLEQNEEKKLTPFRTMKLVQLMINNDKMDDALEILKENSKETASEIRESIQGNILQDLAGKGDVEGVKTLLQALLDNNFAQSNVYFLSPIIKAHLEKDDLDGAINEFERIVNEFKITPYKNVLTQKCIEVEDTEKLQKIIDLSNRVHGDLNSMFDLAFTFIDAGRPKQAQKILETPGLRAQNHRIDSYAARCVEMGKTAELEGVLSATTILFDADRHMIYAYLLEAYKRSGECDKALGLWTSMQEDDLQPSDTFLANLGNFLQSNNVTVPFNVPELPTKKAEVEEKPKTAKPVVVEVKEKTKTARVVPSVILTEAEEMLNKAYEDKNSIQVAMDLKQVHAEGNFKVGRFSNYLRMLLREEKTSEAADLVKEMLPLGIVPGGRVFNQFATALSNTGDINTMLYMEKYLTQDMMRTISYSSKVLTSYRNAGREDEYFNTLITTIKSAKNEELPNIGSCFPKGASSGLLADNPEKVESFKQVVEAYAERGLGAPAQCLWSHAFALGNYDEAQEIHDRYLKEEEQLMFQPVLKAAKDSSNQDMVKKLISMLDMRKAAPAEKGVGYGCLIDILCANSCYDEATATLDQALKSDISLDNIHQTSLDSLKKGLSASGKDLSQLITVRGKATNPSSSSSSSSSSSDSDDDKKKANK